MHCCFLFSSPSPIAVNLSLHLHSCQSVGLHKLSELAYPDVLIDGGRRRSEAWSRFERHCRRQLKQSEPALTRRLPSEETSAFHCTAHLERAAVVSTPLSPTVWRCRYVAMYFHVIFVVFHCSFELADG